MNVNMIFKQLLVVRSSLYVDFAAFCVCFFISRNSLSMVRTEDTCFEVEESFLLSCQAYVANTCSSDSVVHCMTVDIIILYHIGRGLDNNGALHLHPDNCTKMHDTYEILSPLLSLLKTDRQ